MITFILNNDLIQTNLPSGFVLLDFIRKERKLTGTKEGCREGDCGACTVLIGELRNGYVKYMNVNSCLYPLGEANGKHIVTIEGLNLPNMNSLQENFVYQGGTQCGFCTPGFVVSAMCYFLNNQSFSLEKLIEYISGNICRCTGYQGIKRASIETIKFLEKNITTKNGDPIGYLKRLVEINFIPEYFLSIPNRLIELNKKITNEQNYSDVLVSGGTDVYVREWENLIKKEVRIISKGSDLKDIKLNEDEIEIGAAVTISEIEDSELIFNLIPELREFLKLFGSRQIRHRATIGGNIVNASPIGDLINILLVLDAKLILSNGKTLREVLLRDFYKGYKFIDLKENEILKSIKIKISKGKYFFNFEKVSRRTYLDIASVNSSIFMRVENGIIEKINLSAGGVAPIPLYLTETCNFLEGKILDEELVLESTEIAQSEISPISDARGSKEYKSLLLRQLLISHFEKFAPNLFTNEYKKLLGV